MSNQRKNPRQQSKVRNLAVDLMYRAIELTQTTKHDVRCDYSGHVNHISLEIHVDGYKKGVEPICVKRNPTKTELEYDSFVVSGIYLDDNINEVIDFFNVANAELDKLTASDKAA
ncbi:DUF3081 domain-containing protein [Vibrio crassostreae]|uniref:hypothetical protein n=1 Tax=Vibrio crassostreae TaxID=246167 RepID=UPI001B305998|nr:hypothetical protein [Vibrio crassostreae]CAK1819810.1 DUF3081 domain-containing protein [Vibrio crassostreae]CAK1820141.1 DUF3081 domain-containing protein [Vibrio crassostreae]CAK1877932.1 DUF3081 domain-containing protein [Vibrio crassostreae]CAK1881788.1 DUF3081 domain-containing protein [Vibrio crassostreae]CAK1896047.1 DUF3081 domain-containing protein [Vibrio crassostreae]